MKRRTFFVMLILFLVFLNSMILIVSTVILNDKLSADRERCLAEHYVIASSLIGDMQALEQRGNAVEENIAQLARSYSRYLQGKSGGLAVAYSGKWIYKSADPMPAGSPEIPPDTEQKQERMVYMKDGTSPVLCVYGSFPAPWQDYGLLYVGDLKDTFSSWRYTKNFLFLMGAVMMFVMAFFLSQFLNLIFRPLRQISGASAKIAKGDYGSRLLVRGKDEVAGVERNFNLMAEQVEIQIQRLREIAEQKQQFVDNFSHELRIPLTAIYGYAEYMQKALISEEERYECTRFIMSECGRLQNMADQLLDLALLKHGEDERKAEDCSVAALFEQSGRVMRVKAEEKGIRLSYAADRDFSIPGNMEQLLILLNNLIDNGMKASRPGGEIRVSACLKESGAVVEVEDQGIGMAPDQIAHIKDAFYRVDKARSRAAGGAGLGLSICDSIVLLHHGEMDFFSEPGKGTVVRLCFPLGKGKDFTDF